MRKSVALTCVVVLVFIAGCATRASVTALDVRVTIVEKRVDANTETLAYHRLDAPVTPPVVPPAAPPGPPSTRAAGPQPSGVLPQPGQKPSKSFWWNWPD